MAPPPTEQERKEEAGKPWDPTKGSWPLIFAGGPTATSNPGVCCLGHFTLASTHGHQTCIAVCSTQNPPQEVRAGREAATQLHAAMSVIHIIAPHGMPLVDPIAAGLMLVALHRPPHFAAAEPFAMFFDFVALGDGEEALAEIGQWVCTAFWLDFDTWLQ